MPTPFIASFFRYASIVLCLWGIAATTSAQRTQQRQLTLSIGEQTTISASNVASFSMGSEDVADVRSIPSTGRFIVVGKKVGDTTLLLIERDGSQILYNISVKAQTDSGPDRKVPERVNVRLDIYFVEVNRSNEIGIGVAWPAKIGDGITGTGSFPISPAGPATLSLQIEQALPTIDALQNAGWGRFLRHGVVNTTNGTQAHFNSGGEIYVAVPTGQGNIDFKTITFGSRIDVTSNYDASSGRVEIQVEGEFADLFDSGGEIPGRNVTTSRSTSNLQLGQSFVLAGIEARSETRSKAGLPGLSQIPILGVFFGSHNSVDLEKENIVVIVPSIIDSVPAATEGLISEALQVYREYRGDLEEVNLMGVVEPIH